MPHHHHMENRTEKKDSDNQRRLHVDADNQQHGNGCNRKQTENHRKGVHFHCSNSCLADAVGESPFDIASHGNLQMATQSLCQ